jgi:adenylate kinase family enzyme
MIDAEFNVLFIVGGVGSGKTTIGRALVEMLPDAVHISGGEVARKVASEDPELQRLLDAGEFLPPELMDVEMQAAIASTDESWVIVDGYPRYWAQLCDVLRHMPFICHFTYIDADVFLRHRRLAGRGRGEDDEARERKYQEETMPVIEWLMRNVDQLQCITNNGNDGVGHLLPDIIIHHGIDS